MGRRKQTFFDLGRNSVLHARLFPGIFGQAFQPMLIASLLDIIEALAGDPVDLAGLRNVVEVFNEFQ